ncbi:MAG: PadR family transcriptional regulator [Oscillospiraceae bacterium]|jgi:DNA-binding PadR family transcriptional regulator|nr:PadR family transcriptional regulator [Oscillospiraceae bacterium]
MMDIVSELTRAALDTAVLAHLQRGDDCGYRIIGALCAGDARAQITEVALAAALRRLEEAGALRAYWVNEPGGRLRMYALTADGRQAAERQLRQWHTLRALNDFLQAKEGENHAD